MSYADFENDPPARKPQAAAATSQGDYLEMYKAQQKRVQEILRGSKSLKELMKKKEDDNLRKRMATELLSLKSTCEEANKQLKVMQSYVNRSPDLRQGFLKIQKELFGALGQFQEISRENQSRQQRMMDRDQARIRELREHQDDPDEENGQETDALLEDRQRTQKRLQMQSEITHNEAIIRERGQGLQNLQTALVDINEIFKDLNAMAIAQGEPLDSIENAVVTAHEKAVGGVKELKSASRSQKRGRKLMCCLVGLVVCIVTAIIIFLVIFLKILKP